MLLTLTKIYLAYFLVFLLPGFSLALAIFQKKWFKIAAVEKLVITFGLSFFSVNFLIMLMNFLHIPLFRKYIFLVIIGFSIFCFAVYFIKQRKSPLSGNIFKIEEIKNDKSFSSLGNFSYRQVLILVLILFFAVAIRSFYISKGIMPQTTDLGHHMYWSKYIVDFGNLPDYGMPDFIIGEHIIFAAIHVLSGVHFLTALPTVTLLIFNIFSLLAVFVLTFHLAKKISGEEKAKPIAFLSLLIIGCLYAISAPQAKFVSGGVIGNIMGNFFIPFLLYLFYKTVATQKTGWSITFLLSLFSIIFTHHLSTFILLYSFIGLFAALIFLTLLEKPKGFFLLVKNKAAVFFKPTFLVLLILLVLFGIFIFTPSYLNPQAIDTAVGTPFKETRLGRPLGEIAENGGPWRFLFSIFGAVSIVYLLTKKFSEKNPNENNQKKITFETLLAISLLFGWLGMIFIMSNQPGWLKVDIPSNRIVSYITYPLSILSAIGIVEIIYFLKKRWQFDFVRLVAIFILSIGIISGLKDISESARNKSPLEFSQVFQTYLAAIYLNNVSAKEEMVLKDHVNLPGDTWMKIFFMRGYEYPLSRTYDKRYNDVAKTRETCTRDMVAIPDSEIGKACFDENKVKFIVLEKGSDDFQFESSPNFSKIYNSSNVVIFQRK